LRRITHGILSTISIDVNRVAKTLTKACTSAATDKTNSNYLILSDSDTQDYGYGTLTESAANFHGNFLSGGPTLTTADHLVKGAMFSIMARTIFDADTGALNFKSDNLDFTLESIRQTNIFFYNDPSNAHPAGSSYASATGGLDTDIETKTHGVFNATVNTGVWTDEMEYWSYRTPVADPVNGVLPETSSIALATDDKIWCLYQISVNFQQEVTDGQANAAAYSKDVNGNFTELDAIKAKGDQVGTSAFSPFSNASFALKFALSWKVSN
jgi:hypothetical protein